MKFINKKLFLFLIFSLFFITGFLVFNNLVQAQTPSLDVGLQQAAATGLPSTDIRTIVARIIRAALGLLGIVALVLILYAGYLWMTAGGEEEKIATSKKILINATIGLAIILSAYGIVNFVMTRLLDATNGTSSALCEQQKANGGASCDGACPACVNCPYGNCASGQFTIVAMPATGNVCIRNVAPVIVFNLDVDVDSLKDNIVIENVSTSVVVAGDWSLQTNHHHIVYFKPNNGACPAPDTGKDCFAATTTYKIKIKNGGNGVQSAAGDKKLNCLLSTGGCADVVFTTGDGVDRQNPTIKIIYPTFANTDLAQGSNINVRVDFTDDGGLQNLVLNSDGILVDSKNFIGCQKIGTATIVWPTALLKIGAHSLNAIGLDWAANSAESESNVFLKPGHCFNNLLDSSQGEQFIDCGGECYSCTGDRCAKNSDCVSGYCQKQNVSDPEGVCVDKMRIISFSPTEAAKGDYVSIIGKYFGENVGKVYFAKVPHPNPTLDSNNVAVHQQHWAEAKIVDCGPGFKSWTDNQILVSVPDEAVDVDFGTIKVVTAGVTFSDVSGSEDGWGDSFSYFKLSNISHPGICGLTPNNGSVGASVTVKGKSFGIYDSTKSFVIFGDSTKAQIEGDGAGWNDGMILSVAPTSLGNGEYGVKVTNNNQSSNSVVFTVSGTNLDSPFISNISAPVTTTIGDYITITGKNFGNQIGGVWFKLNGSGNAVDGSFVFPSACKNSVWKDNQIVVKVPVGLDESGKKYTIQVYNSINKLSSVLEDDKFVIVNTGDPSPGICDISPVSGKLPFSSAMTVSGEYLNNITKFYFWKAGGVANNIINTLVGVDVVVNPDGKGLSLTTLPNSTVPNVNAITTGLVFAYRSSDQKQSNGLLFSAVDCITQKGCASNSDKCCLSGSQAGMCKTKGQLCIGEFKSSGFVWMFSTKEIIPPPQVVERCGAETESGKNLPSPSPSTKWNVGSFNDASKVCQTALATIEFSSNIAQPTINNSTIILNSCVSIDINGLCVGAKNIPLTNDSYILKDAIVDASQNKHPFLSIKSQSGKWASSTLYQVILKDNITSVPDINGASSTLLISNPCGGGTAYCFSFKTGSGDCVLKQVVVTPNEFWTKVLESPMRYHSAGGDVFDVFYRGNGLSFQHCTMMDVSGYTWQWGVNNKIVNKNYASINGVGNTISTQVNALLNTVGVGLPNDSVDVIATASTSSPAISKTGSSSLTIDLSNPDIIDKWPKCSEACTNSAIGAKFNISMSSHNLDSAVQLWQCENENCSAKIKPIDKDGNEIILKSSFDASSGNTILIIDNKDKNGDIILKSNQLYRVILSSTNTPGVIDNGNQLWSAYDSSDFTKFSKPYNKIYAWEFTTKKEACKIDRVEVLASGFPVFTASKLGDKAIFVAQPYSSPDNCSVVGQKLDAWSQNWKWDSLNKNVATVKTFSTQGSGPYCTSACILKGSTVPSGLESVSYPICGNGQVEAGEDCEFPSKKNGCGLNCKFLGNSITTSTVGVNVGLCGDGFVSTNKGEACDVNDPKTQIGCNNNCLRAGSKPKADDKILGVSVCGNGTAGSGEDCDLGIPANRDVSTSSMYCSSNCLHLGSRLSSMWCFDNRVEFGGFSQPDYKFFCDQSYSQCGDGVQSPDEDSSCELKLGAPTGKHNTWCNSRCLIDNKNSPDEGCTVNTEGCSVAAQHIGSSLTYVEPSLCGDGVEGTGEDKKCETEYLTNKWHKNSSGQYFIDPWVLAIGQFGSIGNSISTTVSFQESKIIGSVTVDSKDISGVGQYKILCGYKTDEECQNAYSKNNIKDLNIGVGSNSCCYFKSKLTSVYPGNTTTNVGEICRNTFIEASFDSVIDKNTLLGNFVIARSMATACSGGAVDVSTSTSFLASFDSLLPWYKNIWNKIVITIKNIFGSEVDANNWCAGADLGDVNVIQDGKGGSKVLFSLKNPLASSTQYVVILNKGIKNIQGVSIESDSKGKAAGWRFTTGNSICEISKVSIDPDQYYFSAPNISADLVAKGVTSNKQLIQPVIGYNWEYQWGPSPNQYVLIGNVTSSNNTIISQNNSGEMDVRAAANITENKYTAQAGLVGTGSSHVIVFLCSNPWPPKQVIVPGQSNVVTIFPYEDKTGNNDGFDLSTNAFDNTPTLPANVGKGYFNFSTYYCADNGDNGLADDLPYLRPAVQVDANAFGIGITTSTLVDVSEATTTYIAATVSTSSCAFDKTKSCTADSDCNYQTLTINQNTFIRSKTGICTASDSSGSSFYFEKNGAFSSDYINAKPLLCDNIQDCLLSPGFVNFLGASTPICHNLSSNSPVSKTSTCESKNIIVQKAVPGFVMVKKLVTTLLPESIKAFKRFIFTNDKNNDAIGIQVLSNPNHLAPRDWLLSDPQNVNPEVVKNFKDINPIDGYSAISDGSNIYISALNFDSSAGSKNGNLYTNIYLFSVSNDATAGTKKVFENLIKNLKFNVNLTNYGYCGQDVNNPGNEKTCTSDFECGGVGSCVGGVSTTVSSVTENVCSNNTNKICATPNDCKEHIIDSTSVTVEGKGICGAVKINNPSLQEFNVSDEAAIQCETDVDCAALDMSYWDNTFTASCILITSNTCDAKIKPTSKSINVCSNNISQKCTSDFDCGGVCSVQKDKLKRNFRRIQDMSKIEKSLSNYFLANKSYPDLKSGTYLSGQTVSTWPSWSLLGNAIPSDPINILGTAGTCSSSTGKFCLDDATCKALSSAATEICIKHDPLTGWSTVNQRFSFACAPNSLAYRYFATSTEQTFSNYLVKLRLEDSGLVVDNFGLLVNSLISNTAHFNILNSLPYGICNQNNEILTINQGTCGDGKVNLNKKEICDPPGSIVWNQSKCNAPAIATTIMTGQVCAKSCQWSSTPVTTTCGILAKCGNGKVEIGESCDEGTLNGQYGHCSKTCNGLSAYCGDAKVTSTYEVCDTKSATGISTCVGGVNDGKDCGINFDVKCNNACISLPSGTISDSIVAIPSPLTTTCSAGIVVSSNKGVCKLAYSGGVKYNPIQKQSCNFDCQSYGPYCGDGFVQTKFGEECDGDGNGNSKAVVTCSVDNTEGIRQCNKNCKWSDTSAISHYRFDDVWVFGGKSHILNSVAGATIASTAYCVGVDCPAPVQVAGSSLKQVMKFNGNNYFTINPTSSFNLNEITFATWINVDPTISDGYHNIISKENSEDGFGGVVGDGRTFDHNRDFNFYLFSSVVGTEKVVNKLSFSSRVYSNYNVNKNATAIFGDNNVDVNIPTNEWHFVAITADASRNVNYYVDGDLVGTGQKNGNTSLKADHNYPIKIGRDDIYFFKGSMDELHIFGRALSALEILDLYQSSQNGQGFCEIKPLLVADLLPRTDTTCGNGKVDANEFCDNGDKNGEPCVTGYNKDCTYCLEGCKNTKQIKATEYCGDGVINGSEICDVYEGFLYSNSTSTNSASSSQFAILNSTRKGYLVPACDQEYNLHLNSSSTEYFNNQNWTKLITQIGSKSCINSCTTISNKCVECGFKTGGAIVAGSLINVLDPGSTSPLGVRAGNNKNGDIDLLYSKNGQDVNLNTDAVAFDYTSNVNKFLLKTGPWGGALSGSAVTINSDPVCNDPAPEARSYKLALNADWDKNHLIDFSVLGNTTPDKYNLILSPVIDNSKILTASKHVRVVISWVGNSEFSSGFIVPGGVSGQNKNITLEDTSPYITTSIGINYDSNKPGPLAGVWYHGFNTVSTTNVEAFTIHTYTMVTSAYAFYVKAPSSPIANSGGAVKLKVEVYMPELVVPSNSLRFSRPIKTYYLSQATPSENTVAQYWHVFNIKKVLGNSAATLENSIEDIGMIRSFIKMDYSTP